MALYNGTLQWHPAMAPRPLQLVVTLPPNHSTLQWHPTMAPSNGTTSTPLKLVVTLPPNHSTTMAPAWCHVQSAKVVRRPPPFLEVRTPIAIAIWGNTGQKIEVLQILPAKMGIWQWNTIASALCKTSITTITITLDVTYQEHKAMSRCRYPKWGQQVFTNYCTLSSVSWFQILGKENSVQMSPYKDLTKLYFWLEICQISPQKKNGYDW